VARYENTFWEKEIQRHPLLTAEEERDLTDRARGGDQAARERMIESNLRLVYSLARGFNNHDVPLDDLVNEGILGLMEAIKRFDPAKGCRFSTYATHWIKQSLRCGIATHGRTVRISPYMREMIGKMRQVSARFTSEEERQPTDEEIARRMEVPLSSVALIRKAMHVTISTDQPLIFGNEESIADQLEDTKSPMPEEEYLKTADVPAVLELLDTIGGRGAEILRTHYGIGREPLTLIEIGRTLNLTKERVRQIENQAIRKLKRLLQSTPGLE
jgi:RNA polymerase primary sigma factor